MAYTTNQALETLNRYLGITDDEKQIIENTKRRGFVFSLPNGEKAAVFVYPLVHKQDNTKNYFDTRDSGAYERGVTWNYAITNNMKYFCIGVNDTVDKYNDYSFSLECNESDIEKISGTLNGSRNGPGTEKDVLAVLTDETKSAQEKYDQLYDRFKGDGSDAAGDNSVERNHGKAIRPYVNLLKPSSGKKDISYEYVPGPFMRMYVKALKNSRTDNIKPFLLIIEEINRANVAAVFGDIFQLLDRGDDFVSEYPIQATEDVKKYLAKELGGDPSDYNKIKIPDNMFIWATMNSADQGVFPMDTAFKRRWDFTYIGIDDSDQDLQGKYVYLADDKSQKVEWNKLRKAINNFLAKEKINEDKQLGPYFISRSIVVPKDGEEINRDRFINTFKNKVIMYLFEDAAKQKRPRLFEGCFQNSSRYSEICREFEAKGVGIFNHDIQLDCEVEDVKYGDTTQE